MCPKLFSGFSFTKNVYSKIVGSKIEDLKEPIQVKSCMTKMTYK